MLREQSDLTRRDAGRDMDLWRHLFAPDDIVRVGQIYRAACEALAAEWCWGNTWDGAVIEGTVALCWPASSAFARSDTRRHNDATRGVRSCYRQTARCQRRDRHWSSMTAMAAWSAGSTPHLTATRLPRVHGAAAQVA